MAKSCTTARFGLLLMLKLDVDFLFQAHCGPVGGKHLGCWRAPTLQWDPTVDAENPARP